MRVSGGWPKEAVRLIDDGCGCYLSSRCSRCREIDGRLGPQSSEPCCAPWDGVAPEIRTSVEGWGARYPWASYLANDGAARNRNPIDFAARNWKRRRYLQAIGEQDYLQQIVEVEGLRLTRTSHEWCQETILRNTGLSVLHSMPCKAAAHFSANYLSLSGSSTSWRQEHS
jgi:hypothetical protein